MITTVVVSSAIAAIAALAATVAIMISAATAIALAAAIVAAFILVIFLWKTGGGGEKSGLSESGDVKSSTSGTACLSTQNLNANLALLFQELILTAGGNQAQEAKDLWRNLYSTDCNDSNEHPLISIHQSLRLGEKFKFKIHARLDASLDVCFEWLVDKIERRPEWDGELVDEARVLHEFDSSLSSWKTRIIYLKLKPIWPLSARDLVLLSHYRFVDFIKSPSTTKQPIRFLVNFTQSIDSQGDFEKIGIQIPAPKPGVVRMHTRLAGQVLSGGDIAGTTEAAKAKPSTLVWQLIDADPGGINSVPNWLVDWMTKQQMPRNWLKLNGMLGGMGNNVDSGSAVLLASLQKHTQVWTSDDIIKHASLVNSKHVETDKDRSSLGLFSRFITYLDAFLKRNHAWVSGASLAMSTGSLVISVALFVAQKRHVIVGGR